MKEPIPSFVLTLTAFEEAAKSLDRKNLRGIQILNNGKSFPFTVDYQGILDDSKEGDALRLMSQGLPSLVLWAFSLEMGLKVLISQEGGKPPRTHNHNSLFFLLRPEVRSRIENSVCSHLPVSKAEFYRELQHNSLIFQDFRYLHESRRLRRAGHGFLRRLFWSVKEEIRFPHTG